MSEEFDKFARKRSNDPAQESLRQAKDDWNQEVKSLIAGLIAFKRGMNGRGDPKTGIPPSSIKDPLPPQVGQYLNGIATQYSKIVDEAKKIIDAQAYYSAHRRKPKAKLPKQNIPEQVPANEAVPKAASIEPSLIAQGSWWGSRAWAYFSLLRKIDKHNRTIRLNMLKSGLDLRKGLKGFEYKLAERDATSTPMAISLLSSVASEYCAVFLRMYDKLADIYKIKAELPKSNPESKKSDKNPEPSTKSPSEPENTPAPTPSEVSPPAAQVDNTAGSATFWEDFNKIYAQLVKMGIVLNHIYSLPNADKTNNKTMKKSFEKFERDISVLYDLSNRSDHDKSAVELEKLTQNVINQYKYLLQAATNILGAAQSFEELATRIPKPKVSEYLQIVHSQEIIKKEATNSVTNWLNKMRLSINPDNIDRMKLEMIESTPVLRQSIDSLMDSLENRDAELDELSKKLSDVSSKFVDLLDQGIALAKNYMIAARREEKDRGSFDIRISDIRLLNEFKNEIQQYVKAN